MNDASDFEPIKVIVPYSGFGYMLLYVTRPDGRHALFAKTLEQLAKMTEIIGEKRREVTVIGAWNIEFRAPSSKVCAAYAVHQAEVTQRRFWKWIYERSNEVAVLPPPLERCRAHSKVELNNIDMDHDQCVNCRNRVVLEGGDYDEWYAARRALFLKAQRVEQAVLDMAYRPRTKRVVAPGRVARDDEALHILTSDFGHHRPGIVLSVFRPTAEEDTQLVVQNPPLAWFRIVYVLPAADYQKIVNAKVKEQAEAALRKRKEVSKISAHVLRARAEQFFKIVYCVE